MLRASLTACAVLTATAGMAMAETWDFNITVDNQYDIYHGTNLVTGGLIGGDTSWFSAENWVSTGRAATDFLYVATASDHGVAQGFLCEFNNITRGTTITTGSNAWQVFPAGEYLQQIFGTSGSWPTSTMPTQAQVDAAITYATVNNKWETPSYISTWDNDATNGTPSGMPWSYFPTIDASAKWIWHDTGRDPGGFRPAPYNGFNHDEFLIFRIAGEAVPAPSAAGLLLATGLLAARRRR